MKNKTPIKWLTAGLIMMLVMVTNQKASGQYTIINLDIHRSIQLDNISCTAGDSIDLNGDTIIDVYIKLQQWPITYGPHHSTANALIIWGAAGDSVAGGCKIGSNDNMLIEGDTINSGSNWDNFIHPFYIEPGLPWTCDCDCSSEKTTYIGLKFRLRNNAIRYGWLKLDYTKSYYSIDYGAYMTNGYPIIIQEN